MMSTPGVFSALGLEVEMEENQELANLTPLAEIELAARRIQSIARRTPLIEAPFSPLFAPGTGRSLWLKAENLQPVGAFKIRGAANRILALSDEERACGVITHSSGNHAQGVAYAARAVGAKAVIVMPRNAPAIKRQATLALGAEVLSVEPSTEARIEKFQFEIDRHGYIPVPPYDDAAIIAGQGTCGLEILNDLPTVDLVLVPVSGGGLISGIAAAIKQKNPKCKVIGVEPELAADAGESYRRGEIVQWEAERVARTLADGLRCQSIGQRNWAHIRAFVDGFVTVTESEIREAMRQIVATTHLVAEPSGAVAAAAALFHQAELPAARETVAILSGGNVSPDLLAEVLSE